MKNTKRFVLGIASSILFSLGFVKAAEHLDPLTQSVPVESREMIRVAEPTEDTGWPCQFADNDL